MNDARLAESAASIVINMYMGILQGIPNLLYILTEFKESSYYHDVLTRDIEFTQNAVTIAADDVSARFLEVKLQEKGIPFDKIPSSLLEDQIKGNGRHIFLCRELDYERIIEAVQEVKVELASKNHETELEFEDEQEIERKSPESGAEEGYEETALNEGDSERPDEEQCESIQISEEKKKKKSRPEKGEQTSSLQQKPSLEASNREADRERENEKRRMQEQGRYEEEKRVRDSNAQYNQEHKEQDLTQDYHHTDISQWESNKKTPQESDPKSDPERNQQAERADSETANRDKSLNLSTGQFEKGKTTKQIRETENWILQGSAIQSASNQKNKSPSERTIPPVKKTGITVLGTGYDTAQVDDSAYNKSQRTGSTLLNHPQSRQSEVFVYQRNKSEPEKEAAKTDSKSHLGPEKPPSRYEHAPGTTRGAIRIQRIDVKALKLNGNITGNSMYQSPFGQHFPFGPQQMNDSFRGVQDTKRVGMLQNSSKYTDSGELFQRTDKTQEILKGRRYYQIRDLLSPDNFRNAVSGTKRVVSQSIVGRDTESGQVANEIADFVSPVAKFTKSRFLNGGAIEIARTTYYDMDVLTAAYAVKNNMTLNEAKSELRELRKLDASLLRNGKGGLNLTNDGAVMKKFAELYQLQGQPASFIGMVRRFDNEKFATFISYLNLSDELRSTLLKTPIKDIDIVKIDSLIKKYGGNLRDRNLLQMLRAGKIMEHYPGAGSFSALFRRYFTKAIKELGRSSDAGRALGTMVNINRNVYHTYRSGIRLLYTILRKFKVVDTNSIAAQVVARMALSKTKSRISKSVSQIGLRNARSVAKTKRIANHASSALKFLKSPLTPLRNILSKNILVKKIGGVASKLGAKIAALAAKASVVLGWIAVIIIIVIILIEVFATIPNSTTESEGTVNYLYVQDTEIMQEIITELTAKNEAFISDINNAANHRGSYGTTAGLTADENVTFYETGAYNIVFRDAYGNELEPSHVDLNNTKTILAMATKFIPYPFQKPADTASNDEKKAYEDIKQHFKDYCYFLWASTHQISIEEYHPGNSGGIEGAMDHSGLCTTLDKGVCDQDGTIVWLKIDFSPDVTSEQYCETCDPSPATGLGTYYDDLCTHGKDGNEHGGWRKTGTTRTGVNCRPASKGNAHHDWCDHGDDGYCDPFTCSTDYYKKECSHVEYEWIYECGGHMGSVVYVTVGELSRMPSFPAATDVDYDAIGKYDTGETISGSDITDMQPESETP